MLDETLTATTMPMSTDRPIIPRDKDLEEFRQSAIPDSMTLANVQFLEGKDALTAFKPLDTTSKGFDLGRGREAHKKWSRSEQGTAIAQGGWMTLGCQMDGSPGTVPLFKPNKPREDTSTPGKFKLVKYETPPNSEALPLLPIVDNDTLRFVYAHLDGQPFWPTVKKVGQPIAIVEGSKKSWSVTAHGLPAVAIRGITQWHQKGSKQLHPTIAQLLSPGQTVYIIFDQDAKETTRKAVRKQMSDLGKAIEEIGCVPLAVGWDEAIGKGIDDALYLKGLGAKDWLEAMLEKAVPPHETLPAAEKGRANIDRLSEIVEKCEIWQTDDRIAMIDVPINNHRESIGINDPRFRSWLASEFYDRTGRHCSSDALGQLIERIRGQSTSAPVKDVFHRIAKIGNEIFLDLGDHARTVIKICGAGWNIMEGECPAKFRRPSSMKAMPLPDKGADWSGLKAVLNLKEEHWVLLMVWLSWGFHPDNPHPILVINGEHGTAKSSATRIIKMLLDPAKALLMSMPREERNLKAHANNRWCLAYDNLSGLSGEMSDALCRLATKSGLSDRGLYTDMDESVFEGVRPVVLNGIEALATRSDLLDRAIILNLEKIDDDQRMTEFELESLIEKCQAQVFGALLNSVAIGLRRKVNVRPIALGRMADFHVWGHCVETAFGFEPGDFERAYQANRNMLTEVAIDNNATATAILQLLETQDFTGSASDLLTKLGTIVSEEQRKARDWIKSPRVLGRQLVRLAPELRKRGIEVESGFRIAGVRTIVIKKIPKPQIIIDDPPPSIEEEELVGEFKYEEPTAPLEVGQDVVFADSDDDPDHYYKLLDVDIEAGSCSIELYGSRSKFVSRLAWLKRREDRSA